MHKVGAHSSTGNLPEPWQKNEEYYYWENGYYNEDNVAVLEVEQTTGPNGQVNSYDSVRPMSWYKVLPSGGRSFYTALGHAADNYMNDQNFINHVRDALLWCADRVNAVDIFHKMRLNMSVSPSTLLLSSDAANTNTANISVYNASGQLVYENAEPPAQDGFFIQIKTGALADGVYFLRVELDGKSVVRKFIKGAH